MVEKGTQVTSGMKQNEEFGQASWSPPPCGDQRFPEQCLREHSCDPARGLRKQSGSSILQIYKHNQTGGDFEAAEEITSLMYPAGERGQEATASNGYPVPLIDC
jgi:hypothetical protein